MPIHEQNFDSAEYQLILDTSTGGSTPISDWGIAGDYVKMSVYNRFDDFIGSFYSNLGHFEVYTDEVSGNIYVAPNEALNNATGFIGKEISTGNYKLQYDFLNNPFTSNTFFIDQISPSRREVRLISRDVSAPPDILTNNELGTLILNLHCNLGYVDHRNEYSDASTCTPDQLAYNFDYVMNLPRAINLPIINYAIDEVSDETPSLVFRFDKSLPGSINRLDIITIEQERITTHIEDIYFVAQEVWVTQVESLAPDVTFDVNVEAEALEEQSYEDILNTTADQGILNTILSGSFDYKNLNIDFNDFNNHIFFGSATKKINNFISKTKEIEDYLVQLSASLHPPSGSGISVTNTRRGLFNKIQTIKDSFTPYESFLYNDGQSQNTASSAPGLGKNLTYTIPVRQTGSQSEILYNQEGFDVVYKHSGSSGADLTRVDLFSDMYRAENAPFFNSDKPVYLSFLIRTSGSGANGDGSALSLTHDNINSEYLSASLSDGIEWRVPVNALGKGFIENPTITSSMWQRVIVEASQSYWRPASSTYDSADSGYDIADLWGGSGGAGDFGTSGTADIEILTGSNVTSAAYIDGFAYGIKDSLGKHSHLISPASMSGGGTFPVTTTPVTGSVLPSGELFRIHYDMSSYAKVTGSLITDVKVSFNNPSSSLPFSSIYSTGSAAYQTWHNNISAAALSFDEKNIHSLYNNLPKNIRENIEYADLHVYIDMMGEFYDVVRNHIDNFTNLNKRNYDKFSSVPDNLLPILGNNLNWEFINPFTGSLDSYFNNVVDAGDNLQNIQNNTWKKVLNNLIYIYKSKGTQNSIRALLNAYGHPTSLMSLQEHGGSLTEQNPLIITNDIAPDISGLSSRTGSVSYVHNIEPMHSLELGGNQQLNLDWNTNGANGSGLEFIVSTRGTGSGWFKTQLLAESSGSGDAKLWQIHKMDMGFTFHLNTGSNGTIWEPTTPLILNPYTSSRSELSFNDSTSRAKWHLYLNRDTTTGSNALTQSIVLYAGLQDRDKLLYFTSSYLRVSSSTAIANFVGTGSLPAGSSGNLVFGSGNFTGSVAEIRMWENTLSASKFKQHIHNKSSVVGNTVNSWKDERVWHYRLNENYLSGSNTSYTIKDANPHNNEKYDKQINFTDYASSWVDKYKLSVRVGGDEINNNKVIISEDNTFFGNLNPRNSILTGPYRRYKNHKKAPEGKTSIKLSWTNDFIKKIDDYIFNLIPDARLGDYMLPEERFENDYSSLNKFRDSVLKGVNININKTIRANNRASDRALIEDAKKVLPIRAQTDRIGLLLRSDILHRNKYKSKEVTFEELDYTALVDANLIISSGSIINEYTSMVDYLTISSGSYSDTYNGLDNIDILSLGSFEEVKFGNITNILPTLDKTYEGRWEDNINVMDNVIIFSSRYGNLEDTILYNTSLSESEKVGFYSSNNLDNTIIISSNLLENNNFFFGNINANISTSFGEYLNGYSTNILISDILNISSTYDSSLSGMMTNFTTISSDLMKLFNSTLSVGIKTDDSDFMSFYSQNLNIDILTSSEYAQVRSALEDVMKYINISSEKLDTRDSLLDVGSIIVASSTYDSNYNYVLNPNINYSGSFVNVSEHILYALPSENGSFYTTFDDTIKFLWPIYSSSYQDTMSDILKLGPAEEASYYSLNSDELSLRPTNSGDYSETYTATLELLWPIYSSSYQEVIASVLNALPTETASYMNILSSTINYITAQSSSFINTHDFTLDALPIQSGSFRNVNSTILNASLEESMSFINTHDFTLDALPIQSMSYRPTFEYTLDTLPIQSMSYISANAVVLDTLPAYSMSYTSPNAVVLDTLPIQSMSYISANTVVLDTLPIQSMSYTSPNAVVLDTLPIQSMSYRPTFEYILDTLPIQSSSLGSIFSGSDDYIATNAIKPFKDWHALWGTGINDVHFCPPVQYRLGNVGDYDGAGAQSGSDGFWNTWHEEKRYVFKSIGDVEYISASNLGNDSVDREDMSNYRSFLSRALVDTDNSTYTYNSLFPFGSTVNGIRQGEMQGRAMGMTYYFATGSDGSIWYPSNHVSKFLSIKQQIPILGHRGTQNVDPGFWQHSKVDDHSTASFYSITVVEDLNIKIDNPTNIFNNSNLKKS